MKRLILISLMIGTLMLTACAKEPLGDNINETVAETEEVAQEESQERPPAIDFTMTDWQGEAITLSDYQGKIVFLNFFATWCPPCEEEMPVFQQAYEDYEGDVVFQIIDVYASEREGYQHVIDWYTEGGFTMPMIIDEEDALGEFYPIRAFPTTFVIDRKGNVLGYLEGGMSREMVDNIILQADM